MSATRVFVARLAGCTVFDPAGDRVGRVRDVLVVYRRSEAPQVVGMIVEIPGRRRVFLPIGRVTSIAGGQVITTGLINVRRFHQRGGEVAVIAELIGRVMVFKDGSGEATIEDVAIESAGPGRWAVSQLFMRRPKPGASLFGKQATLFAGWEDVRERTGPAGQGAEHLVASYSDLKPADLATALLALPPQRMLDVIDELPDARVADALEEMPEASQVSVLGHLEDLRAADVLDQMQPDDAADLIGQLGRDRREALLALMEPDEADDIRMLLTYPPESAGGLMTTELVILAADATVAEALALIRRRDLAPALAAAVCVTLPPYEPPTGHYLGIVHFQRLLRHAPHEHLGTLIDATLEAVHARTSAAEVSRILASYNLVQLPVVDDTNRLVGVVTIDDVLDYVLPDNWRSHDEPRGTHVADA